MLLVSACLLGVNCTFFGRSNENREVQRLIQRIRVLPVCPEQLGGLSTPRPPAEIQKGDGFLVLNREALVFTSNQEDVTREFFKGARETLNMAKIFLVKGAILKEGSPSCGRTYISDGTFSGEKISGMGVTAALLEKEGVPVFSENQLEKIRDYLDPSGRERIYIGVIGANKGEEEILDLAYQVGQLLASNNAVLVCGGRGGVMEAAARGTWDEGGIAIGILPGQEKGEGNPYLEFSLATGLGDARNAIITRAADALIAIGGSYGTLSEIGLALKMGKPVIGLHTWQLTDGRGIEAQIKTASSPQEAVFFVFEALDL